MRMDLMWFYMDSIHMDCYGFEYGFIVSALWGVRWELVYGVPTIGADWLTFSDDSTTSTPRLGRNAPTRHAYGSNTCPYRVYVWTQVGTSVDMFGHMHPHRVTV